MPGVADPTSLLARRAADEVDARRVVALTRELVRIRSVFEAGVDGSNETEAARFIAATLRGSGFHVTVEDASPGRPNVIADWQGSAFDPARDRTLMFEGHSDVVTEGDASTWTKPPFAAELHDGRIYGRGSADMKGGVAAAVAAVEAVARVVPGAPGRIRLGVVADEEGMMSGIKSFIANGWAESVSAAIICEPEENEICLFQKGAMRLGFTFTGAMAHGAMPYAGLNPIPLLGSFLAGLRQIEVEEQRRVGEHPHLGLPWLTPTVVRAPREGDQQLNVMPETAYLAVDVRTVPGQEHDTLRARLEDLARTVVDEVPGAAAAVELIEERPWTQTAEGEPIVAALQRAFPIALGRPPRYGGVPGATDGTFLHALAGVPIVTVGPGDRTIPHQRDEYVETSALVDAARLYAAAAVEFLLRRPDR